MHPALVRTALWYGERLVVVNGIPALVCDTCKEQYFDDTTAVRLDLLRGAGFPEDRVSGELRVPVFEFGKDRFATGEEV